MQFFYQFRNIGLGSCGLRILHIFLLEKNPILFSILLRKKILLKLVQADPVIGQKAGKMK
jgi:hypothetical protein